MEISRIQVTGLSTYTGYVMMVGLVYLIERLALLKIKRLYFESILNVISEINIKNREISN